MSSNMTLLPPSLWKVQEGSPGWEGLREHAQFQATVAMELEMLGQEEKNHEIVKGGETTRIISGFLFAEEDHSH